MLLAANKWGGERVPLIGQDVAQYRNSSQRSTDAKNRVLNVVSPSGPVRETMLGSACKTASCYELVEMTHTSVLPRSGHPRDEHRRSMESLHGQDG